MKGRIRNLRIIGIMEGISYLVLLGIAMPLKYYFNIPEAVKIIGWLHGVLFILYIPAVFLAKSAMQWNLFSLFMALAASVIPFGTFVLDKHLIKRETALKHLQSA